MPKQKIVTHVIELVEQKGKPMPGVDHIINFFLNEILK